MNEPLHLANSDGADALKLHVGNPPVLVLDGVNHKIEGSPISIQDIENLWHSIANTRQRRELMDKGEVQFIYRFRRTTDFVVRAQMEEDCIGIDIH